MYNYDNGHWDGFQNWGRGCRYRSFVTLTGRVTNAGMPAANIQIQYTVNCSTNTVNTDANGNYSITVERGSNVTITPTPMMGASATPLNYMLGFVCQSQAGLDFTLNPVTPMMFTVSGSLQGLTTPSGVTINYTVNGMPMTTTTSATGAFNISAAAGSNVVITSPTQSGFNATPLSISIPTLSANSTGNNIVYTAM